MLVVEDDAAIRTVLLEVLVSEGLAAHHAGNGREALEVMAARGHRR